MEQKTQAKSGVPSIPEKFKQIGENFIAIASELAAAAGEKQSSGKPKPTNNNKTAQEAKTSAETKSPEKAGEQPAASDGNKPACLAGKNTSPAAGNQANKPINPQRMKTIFELAKANRIWANELSKQMFGGRTVKELTDSEATKLLEEIQRRIANGSK